MSEHLPWPDPDLTGDDTDLGVLELIVSLVYLAGVVVLVVGLLLGIGFGVVWVARHLLATASVLVVFAVTFGFTAVLFAGLYRVCFARFPPRWMYPFWALAAVGGVLAGRAFGS